MQQAPSHLLQQPPACMHALLHVAWPMSATSILESQVGTLLGPSGRQGAALRTLAKVTAPHSQPSGLSGVLLHTARTKPLVLTQSDSMRPAQGPPRSRP